MRAVVQRVLNAGVTVDGEGVGRIGRGYLVLLGVGHGDTRAEADKLWGKLRPELCKALALSCSTARFLPVCLIKFSALIKQLVGHNRQRPDVFQLFSQF